MCRGSYEEDWNVAVHRYNLIRYRGQTPHNFAISLRSRDYSFSNDPLTLSLSFSLCLVFLRIPEIFALLKSWTFYFSHHPIMNSHQYSLRNEVNSPLLLFTFSFAYTTNVFFVVFLFIDSQEKRRYFS